MQTLPSFAYLAPLALLFGIGSPSAIAATFIYALPPLVRISAHGLRTVSPTTVEATTSMGSTSPQLMRKVQLPMAKRTVIVGLNQTIMSALSMATICAFIGAKGLGVPVIQALSAGDVGSRLRQRHLHRVPRHHARPVDGRCWRAIRDCVSIHTKPERANSSDGYRRYRRACARRRLPVEHQVEVVESSQTRLGAKTSPRG